MTNTLRIALAGASMLALANCSQPQQSADSSGVPSTGEPQIAAPDLTDAVALSPAEYVQKAAVGDMYEIEASRIALQRSKTPAVKAFAQMMIDDHSATTAKLKPFAAAANLTAPATLDDKHQAMLTNLRNVEAENFDELYLDQQTEAHEDALTIHTNFAKSSDAPALAAFAAETAPKVAAHLDRVRALDESGVDEPPKG